MVTREIEVYRVKNTGSGKYEFFEGDRLPRDANSYDLANKELIDSGDELLTLTASEAVEYGVARAQVRDLQGVLDFLAKRDGVTFVGAPMVLNTSWSEEMVRWVNSPVVMGVLIVIALLGVYIELSSPGVGLPGLVAVICFVIIVGSRYLTGLANWIEVVVLVVGMVLLAIEIFVLPGFGIAGILGIMCILAGLFGMLVHNAPNEVPWPRSELDWHLFTNGVIGLSAGVLGFLVLAWVFAKYLPRIPVASRMILAGPEESAAVRLGGAPAPGSVPEVTVGQQGVSVTQLRPSGIGRFGSERLSVVSQGELIEANREIIVAQMDGNSIVVKEVRGSNNKA
jgi:membrane-bound serine protease (ClpP class)